MATNDLFGQFVDGAGDINGDGVPDFIIGANGADTDGVSAGSAFVYSGATGDLLYKKNGTAFADNFGWSARGAGDVNGDGRADFIVAAFRADPGALTNAGAVFVYSGADGSLLYQKNGATANDEFGYYADGAGDVNGDGNADFIIGARWADPGGRVDAGSAFVYSGADGSLLYHKEGAADNDNFGSAVGGVGDVNSDGRADFIVGAPLADPEGLVDAGSAYVYSGVDGSLLHQKNGDAVEDNLGYPATGIGDANGDGVSDFIISARYTDPGGLVNAGSVYVYSGADGSILHQKNGATEYADLGASAAGAGDTDGDGREDFIIGAPGAPPGGSAFVYSGATGILFSQVHGAVPEDELGFEVAGIGDINGDGNSDFIIGARADPGGAIDAGSAFVFALTCSAAKGDLNASGDLSMEDIVLMLNCVFLDAGSCHLCFADVNCSGGFSPADVVIELIMVFLSAAPPC